MWAKFTGDMGKPLFVNLRQVSVLRQPAQGAPGARLACLSGSTVPVQQSFGTIARMLRERAKADAGLWMFLTNEYGKPVAANFERARIVRSGPSDFGGGHVGLPARVHALRAGIAGGDRGPSGPASER